jgi:uncharacterized protein
MSERTRYDPGTFSWADLTTTDLSAAKRFYSELHGWEYRDNPLPGGAVYAMATKDGHDVAALAESQEQPPHWNNYVTVESADDAAKRAEDAGATIVEAPFDVMTAGRMTVVQDPTGAIFCAWEPRDNIGAKLVNADGALAWNDLTTNDVARAERFYADLFGWRTREIPNANGYRVIYNGERSNGGMIEEQSIPPNWMPYFGTDDLDGAIALVERLGGRKVFGPQTVPSGAFAVIADPQGAISGILSAEYDD